MNTTVRELIETLEQLAEQHGDDSPVGMFSMHTVKSCINAQHENRPMGAKRVMFTGILLTGSDR